MEDSNRERHTLKDSLAVQLTGKIMVAAIIVLFMVVVFVLLLHLYAKWFWWRVDESTNSPNQTRSRRRRRFVFVPGQDPAVARGQRRGLDPAILKSLPILAFHPEDFKDGLECAVCLSDLVQGEKARLLPKCNHGFHVDCIDMWFQSHSTCPLCRNPVASETSDSNASTITNGNMAENIQSPAENVAAGYTSESPNFPTNVLFWGNQTRVSSRAAVSEVEEQEGPSFEPPCPSLSSASSSPSTGGSTRPDGMLVIDIPSEINSSSLSPSASRFAEEDLKSPMTTRLRSLKRLLSREKRSTACSPSSVDVDQVDRAQS